MTVVTDKKLSDSGTLLRDDGIGYPITKVHELLFHIESRFSRASEKDYTVYPTLELSQVRVHDGWLWTHAFPRQGRVSFDEPWTEISPGQPIYPDESSAVAAALEVFNTYAKNKNGGKLYWRNADRMNLVWAYDVPTVGLSWGRDHQSDTLGCRVESSFLISNEGV